MTYRDNDSPSYWASVMRAGSPDAQADEDARQAHLERIRQYVLAWQAGQLTLEEKRRAISDENRQFYGPDCPKHLLWHAGK